MTKRLPLYLAILLAAPMGAAHATPISYTGTSTGVSSGKPLSAKADFSIGSAGDLTVTLYNTGTYDVTQPSDILQAVYWSMASDVSLQLVSATTAAQVQFTSSGNHQYGGGSYTESAGQTYSGTTELSGKYSLGSPIAGIGSAGLGNFGNTVGGGDYGILPTAWNPDNLTTYNGGMVNNSPYAQGHVTFHLKATANGAPITDVGALGLKDVNFQWGTSPDLVGPATVPAPSTLALMPLAIGLMAAVTRKRRRRT